MQLFLLVTSHLNISNKGEKIAVNIDGHDQRPFVLVCFYFSALCCFVLSDSVSNKDI